MFTGLSAFPLTPVTASGVDEKGFSHILSRLTEARVDSMGILGSTGSYAYLTREQRKRVATLAKQHAGDIPVMVCVGAVRSVPMPFCIWQMMHRQLARMPCYSRRSATSHSVTKKSSHSLRLLPGTCLYRCVSMIIRARRILPLRTNFTVVSHHLRVFARSRSLASRIAPLQRLSG